MDDETSRPLQGIKIKIYTNKARKIAAAEKTTNEQGMFPYSNMARKITAVEKTTNEQGMFRFSGYAGRSGGVSYSFIAEKEGYDPYKGSFTLEANKAINLPSINLVCV